MIAAGDIHERTDFLAKILKEFRLEKILFSGDIADPFGIERALSEKYDYDEKSKKSIYAMESVLGRSPSKTIILAGNHEYNYAGPYAYYFKHQLKIGKKVSMPYAEGFNKNVFKELNQLIESNKDRFKIAYYEKNANVLFTHAGITPAWINLKKRENDMLDLKGIIANLESKQPFNISQQDLVFEIEQDLKENAMFADYIVDLGIPKESASGPLWCFLNGFRPVPGLNQVFGHTHIKSIIEKSIPGSINYCISCINRDQVLEIDEKHEGKFRIIDL